MLGGGIIREVTGIFGLGIPAELRRDGARLTERIREFEVSQAKDREIIIDLGRSLGEYEKQAIGDAETIRLYTERLSRAEARLREAYRISRESEADIGRGETALREAYSGIREIQRIIDELE